VPYPVPETNGYTSTYGELVLAIAKSAPEGLNAADCPSAAGCVAASEYAVPKPVPTVKGMVTKNGGANPFVWDNETSAAVADTPVALLAPGNGLVYLVPYPLDQGYALALAAAINKVLPAGLNANPKAPPVTAVPGFEYLAPKPVPAVQGYAA
jgi:hypothetical protein